MYRFPLWKHLLVLAVLVVAALFALPNAFGEDPALQLSRDDRAAMDDASQQRVLGILSAAAIPVAASHIEEDRLVVRFPLVDQQLKARDAILDAAGSQYLVALTNAPRTAVSSASPSTNPVTRTRRGVPRAERCRATTVAPARARTVAAAAT